MSKNYRMRDEEVVLIQRKMIKLIVLEYREKNLGMED